MIRERRKTRMSRMTLLFVLVAAAAPTALSVGSGSAADVTPLQKVVQMLDGVLAKGKKEKHEEEVEFAKFHEWCDNVPLTRRAALRSLAMRSCSYQLISMQL